MKSIDFSLWITRFGYKFVTLAYILIILIVIRFGQISVYAQKPDEWTPAAQIPGFEDNTWPPYLVADQNRTVHAFSSQWTNEALTINAIMYNQWTPAKGWTEPNDIILPPYYDQAFVEGVFLDSTGTLHLMFFGGNDRDANIYYSTAPAAEAAKAPAWSKPYIVATQAKTPRTAALAGDNQGNLVIVYHGNQDGNGLYAVYSQDNGNSWSEPESIFLTYDDKLWPWSLQLYWGKSGRLHAVWNVVQITGANETGYYARMDNIDDKQWTEPMHLAESAGLGIAIPAVVERGDEVFLIFNNGISGSQGAPVQWSRYSTDGGRTWTPPVRPFANHVGRNGTIAFAIDSNNDLHVFFGQRIPLNPDIHGMWHSIWQDGRWMEPLPLVSGPAVNDPKDGTSFDPYEARAVTVQGNILLATWRTDPGLPGNGVWYSYKKVDAPELPVEMLPTVAAPTPVALATTIKTSSSPVAAPTPRLRPTLPTVDAPPSHVSPVGNNPVTPIILGIAPVFVLITGVFIFAYWRYFRRS